MDASHNGYGSVRGIRTETVPWRLYEKAKRNFWDPANLDFSGDAADWATLTVPERNYVGYLAARFMIGEEQVTVDILPLLEVVAAEGRLEETIYLTTFAFEEAKHVDFFTRWFDAVGFAIPPEYAEVKGIVHSELPRVMGRLKTDPCPEAMMDAALTYNQVVEGVLAISGYRVWQRIFSQRGILPGLQAGLEHVQRDERRHIAYGTYLCRRLLSEHPDLWDFVQARMQRLQYMVEAGLQQGVGLGPAGPFGSSPGEFLHHALRQFPRRLEVIEVARRMRTEEVDRDQSVEDLEAEFASA